MVKWFRLTKNQYVGFFAVGLILFLLQELPYIVMPFISLDSNPLMEMQDASVILNLIEKVLGVSSIVTMLFLVHAEDKWFSLKTSKEKIYFGIAMAAIVGYFVGWIFYVNGFQSLPLMLCTLVALPPIYYALIGMWRRNYVLVVLGSLFFVAHVANVWNNLGY